MKLDWNDLELFLTVARLGGLRAAADTSGVSPATLGRRMSALEAAVGQTLFERSLSGYRLTANGEDLLRRAAEVEAAMQGIRRWSDGTATDPPVLLSAGRWMSGLLAQHIGELWQVDDHLRLEFVSTFDAVDVSRRAADIDLRGERPTEPGLAQRLSGRIAFAIYSGRNRINGVEAGYFVGLSGEAESIASSRWLQAHHGDRIGVRVNDVWACRELAAAGAGLTVLPCFVGDADPRLARLGQPIPELMQEIWIVTHAERRQERPVRLVASRLAKLFDQLAPVLRGERPS